MDYDWESGESEFADPQIRQLCGLVESQWDDGDWDEGQEAVTVVAIESHDDSVKVPIHKYDSQRYGNYQPMYRAPVYQAPDNWVASTPLQFELDSHQHDKGISLRTAVYLSMISFSSWLLAWVALILLGVIK